jgi:E3 ubiquitin-protein ligase BRE1
VNDQKEMKLLLDMYKGVSKEQRDKVQLMAAEKKTRAELEDIRQQLKKMQVHHSPVTQMAVGNMWH